MQYLAKAGNDIGSETALAAGETTRSFSVISGIALYTLEGTFDSETVTMQMSPTGPAGYFSTYVAKDVTGTPAAVTYTEPCSDLVFAPGQTFRFTMSSNGGTADVNILVSGDGVVLH